MPFNRLDLARVASASTGAPAMWLYLSEVDALADILNADYFGAVAPQLRVNDVMCCRLTDRNCWMRVLSVNSKINQVVTEQTDFISPTGPEGQNLINWRGIWQSNVYEKNDQVTDNGWVMIANKTTVDRPSPQPTGDPEYSLEDVPAWLEENNVSTIYSGQKWTFTASGWVNTIRVWVPEITADTSYRFIVVVEVPEKVPKTTIIERPDLNADGWTSLGFGTTLVLAGTVVKIVIVAVNSSANTNILGDWRYQGSTQTGAPLSQNWTQDNQRTNFRISKIDLDTADRGAALEAVIAESTITVVQESDSGRTSIHRVTNVVDSGLYMTYTTTLITETGGGIADGQPCNLDIEVPIPLAAKYEELIGHWPTNNPTWATVEGYLAFDEFENLEPGSELNAYGTDLLFNEGIISQDWDVVKSVDNSLIVSIATGEVFSGFDFTDQNPTGLDAPVLVKFGGTIGTPSDPVSMVNDIIQFNESGVYSLRYILSVSRTTVPGTAYVFFRALINGIQTVNPIAAIISDNDTTIPLEFTTTASFTAGTSIVLEMYRDSIGVDNGGLASQTSSIGWGPSPSASIRITKL